MSPNPASASFQAVSMELDGRISSMELFWAEGSFFLLPITQNRHILGISLASTPFLVVYFTVGFWWSY